MQDTVVILCWKSPYPIRGGLDLRVDGICKALSKTNQVVLICLEGAEDVKPDYVSGIKIAPKHETPQNHVILKWGLENPEDPFGIFVHESQTNFIRNQLIEISPENVIISRTMMWRFYIDTRYHLQCNSILDLDESSKRLSESFANASSIGPQIKFIGNYHKRNIDFENQSIKDADYVLVSSEIEKKECLEHKSPEHIVVINNVVHPSNVSHSQPRSKKRILFPGNFDYPPNREAFKEIAKTLAPRLLDYEFVIAGSGTFNLQFENRNIEVKKNPEYMSEEFLSSEFLIAPIRFGAGTRLKVLEALHYGTAVIATKFAVEGLHLEPGIHYYQAESPSDFIIAIEELGANEKLKSYLTENGREFVHQNHRPEAIEAKLKGVLRT